MATKTRGECKQQLLQWQQQGFSTINGELIWDEELPGLELMRMFKTAWTCNGGPVIASTIVRVNENDPFDGSGDFSHMQVDYRVVDQKISEAYEISKQFKEGQVYLMDPLGNAGDFNQACDLIKNLSIYSCLFPHVILCNEFITVEGGKRRKLCQQPLHIDVYLNEYLNQYLPRVEQDLRNGSAFFVGRITKVDDLHIAYESAKQYQKFTKNFFGPDASSEPVRSSQKQGNVYQAQNTSRQPEPRKPQGNSSAEERQQRVAANYYKNMLQKGFSIPIVKDGFLDNDPQQPRRVQVISTPWFYRGNKVEANTGLQYSGMEVDYVVYKAVNKRDYRDKVDITDRLFQRDAILKDASGRKLDIEEATKQLIEIAQMTSALPHVLMYPEYLLIEGYRASVEGRPAPSESTYLYSYLPQIENKLRDSSYIFIGMVQQPDDLDIARYSLERTNK